MISSDSILIKGGKLIWPEGAEERGDILINKGIIADLGGDIESLHAEVIDAQGMWVAPGFIDLHVHGGGGLEVMDGSYEAICTMAKVHSKGGTTAFLPSAATASHDEFIAAIDATLQGMEKGTGGAQVLGINLEGPYLNPKKRGAQRAEDVRVPDIHEFEEFWEASKGTIKLITVAPEVEGAIDFIKMVRSMGVRISVGHSDATFEEAINSFEAGVSHVTHTFNGMSGLHHREPGLAGAALLHPSVMAELIADGVHIHPKMMELFFKVKGREGICLVTDAISGMGLPDGIHTLAGERVIVDEGVCRIEDGTLAGSTLTMSKAVKNMIRLVGVSLQDAIRMATLNPAMAIGIEAQKGDLKPGMDGDIVILDENLDVVFTIARGEVIYSKSKGFE